MTSEGLGVTDSVALGRSDLVSEMVLLRLRGRGGLELPEAERDDAAAASDTEDEREDTRLRLLGKAGTLLEKATLLGARSPTVEDSRREKERADIVLKAAAGGAGTVVFFLVCCFVPLEIVGRASV